jgi:hypothetical protein
MKFFETTRSMILAALAALALMGVPALAQYVASPLQNGVPTGPSVTGADTTSGIYFGTNRTGVSGHLESGLGTGDLPAVSTCGTSAALATGSTDNAGKITVGTSASNACTLTFGTAYTTAPFCVVQNKTTGAAANVYTISTTAIVWSSALADSSELFYHCIAPSGG